MRDRDLDARILGLSVPWHVSDMHLDVKAGSVEIVVEHRGQCRCPTCGKACPGYDSGGASGATSTPASSGRS